MFFNFFKNQKQSSQEIEKKIIVFNPIGLDDLVNFIRNTCGIDLSPKKQVLEKRLRLICEKKELSSFFELLNIIKLDNVEYQNIIDLITVNETYFYRELPQLQEAIEHIKSLNRRVKILCAPCATGEEVYSLAFLSNNANIIKENINILGIDISSQAIFNANEGIYSSRSLHRLDENTKNYYFLNNDEKYKIKRELLPKIEFKVLNIFDKDFQNLEKYDFIFSRNMMIYFDDEYKYKAIKIFHKLLHDGGRLYTGHADLIPKSDFFEKIIQDRLYYYIKK